MSFREELTINQRKIKDLDTKISDASEVIYNLETINLSLKASILEEEQLLANSKWYLKAGKTLPYLEYQGSVKDELMVKVFDLICNGFHCSFYFSEKVHMQFDDNKVTLQFEDPNDIIKFVNKFKIVINGDLIKDALRRIKKDALAIEMICHQLQLNV